METIGANVFVETVYPGINVGCIITDEGAICVDTPLLPGEAQRWMARIQSLGVELVRFVVYTSGQSERILGTQYFVTDRQVPLPPQPVSAQRVIRPRPLPFRPPAPAITPEQSRWVQTGAVLAHKLAWDQVKEHRTDGFKQSMIDMFGERDPDMTGLDVILPQITVDDCVKLYVGDIMVTLLAAADAVLWVWLLEQRVLFTGDMVVVGAHPPLAAINLPAWLATLEQLCQDPQFQDTIIVPGRGPLSDLSAVAPLIEYLRIACRKTERIYGEGRSKAELNEIAAELLPMYPVADGQRERVQRQIKLGLDNLYDALKVADAAQE